MPLYDLQCCVGAGTWKGWSRHNFESGLFGLMLLMTMKVRMMDIIIIVNHRH